MQLHEGTAKKYGVNPLNPRENIMGGAAVLARLLDKYDGNIKKVLRVYNSTPTDAYVREVLRAYEQAQFMAILSLPPLRRKN
jgi:soluble lytic murein transglycosylase-like protein